MLHYNKDASNTETGEALKESVNARAFQIPSRGLYLNLKDASHSIRFKSPYLCRVCVKVFETIFPQINLISLNLTRTACETKTFCISFYVTDH